MRECVVVLALLGLVVAQQELCFVCTLVAVHVVIFTKRGHTHAALVRVFQIVCHYDHDMHVSLYVLALLEW